MRFNRLSLINFRNIESQSLDLNSGLNVFRGQNGQGKTNLIEALALVTSGRSFRTSNLSDLVNKSNPMGFHVQASVEKQDLDYSIEMKVSPKQRSLKVNHQRASAAQQRKHFPSLLFSPESLLIVKDSAQKRRDLIDDLCLALFPEFLSIYLDFKKAYKQKNSLLKKIKTEENPSPQNRKINESLTQLLLQKGAQLTHFRLLAIEEIEPVLLKEFLEIMDNHYGNISIDYLVSGHKTKASTPTEILNAMYKRWEELKSRELASGQCLVGPHKHDIRFNFNGQEARFFCSQGQQRAIILAFKMAQTRLHYRAHKVFPILLLDDVLSELDKEKQMRFVNYLLSTEAQIFLTTTDATAVPLDAATAVFEVENGVFKEAGQFVTGGLSV